MWPAFVGCGLLLGGLLLIAIPADAPSPHAPPSALPTAPPSAAAGRPGPDARALKGLILGCAVWIALLIPLGWAPATLLTGLIFGRAAGDGWRDTFLLTALVLAGLGLGVETLLRFPLPGGLWGRALDALAVWPAGPGGPA